MQRLYRANVTATDGLYPTMWTTFTGEPLNSTLFYFISFAVRLVTEMSPIQMWFPWAPLPIAGTSTY